MFSRLGPWCHDHRWKVVIGWVVLLFVGNGIAGAIGEAYRQDFSLNGFESTEGFALVEEEFADGSGSPQFGSDRVPGRAGRHRPRGPGGDGGCSSPRSRRSTTSRRCRARTPLAASSRSRTQGAAAGTIAYATVNLPEDIDFTRAADDRDEIERAGPRAGRAPRRARRLPLRRVRAAVSPSCSVWPSPIIILIVAFGSVLAMGLPVGTALAGIGLGGALVIIASHLLEVPDFAPFIGVMIGLGVGIDYALLIVTRYREQLHAGHDIRESIGIAMDTAGRSVVFAGATVVDLAASACSSWASGSSAGSASPPSLTVAASPCSPRSRCCPPCSASPASTSSAPSGAA